MTGDQPGAAGLRPEDLEPDRVAVQMGSALGGVAYAELQALNLATQGIRAVDPRVALTTFAGAASCSIAIEFGFTGPNATNAMSCASGTIALGEAWRLIREGLADAAIAGNPQVARAKGDPVTWPYQWADDALAVSKLAYQDVVPGKLTAQTNKKGETYYTFALEVPQNYPVPSSAIAKTQLIKGGYNLAAILEAIFSEKG